jgi:hypothetical protein
VSKLKVHNDDMMMGGLPEDGPNGRDLEKGPS